MSDVLSQNEIDDLLSILSTGEVTAEEMKEEDKKKKIKVYDFKRPNKFSKDQVNTLQVIFENYSRSITTYLSAHLRTSVKISVASIDELTYDEFIRSISNPSIINIFKIPPLEGSALFEINPTITFAIIERMLGGIGIPLDQTRGLTDLERTVVMRINQKMLDYMREAWANIIDIDPLMELIEHNPQFTQIVSPTEMVVVITLDAKIGESEGMINFCLPYIVLEPIISKLSTHFWFSSTAKEYTTETITALKKRIEKAKIPLTVRLGETNLTVEELVELQAGDVVTLERETDQELDLYVGNRLKYKCKPGLIGSKMAVEVTSVVTEGDDEDG
ncbi:flagellar motor switch protein FliM [Desulfitispora alkaliphila]|uniref:flagellar motor switch protein FliM n=1 Tax=Desulfitispora alkaliphila TaxID=622674 RepID=UPI003D1EC6A5